MDTKYYIHYLRILAAFCVVVIHATAPFFTAYASLAPSDWLVSDVLNSFSRFSVPMFVAISGALILDKVDPDPGSFYRKRLVRFILPLLVWNTFYFFYAKWTTGITFRQDLILTVGRGATFYHLWYLSMWMGMLLFLPAIASGLRGEWDRRRILWFLGLCAAFLVMNQAATAVDALTRNHVTWFAEFVAFIPMLFLGNVLFKAPNGSFPNPALLIGAFVIICLVTAGLNYEIARKLHVVNESMLQSYTGVVPLLTVGCLFMAFARMEDRLPHWPWVAELAGATFGIYLLHPVFLFTAFWGSLLHKPVPAMIASCLGAFVLSAICVVALRHFRFFKAIS